MNLQPGISISGMRDRTHIDVYVLLVNLTLESPVTAPPQEIGTNDMRGTNPIGPLLTGIPTGPLLRGTPTGPLLRGTLTGPLRTGTPTLVSLSTSLQQEIQGNCTRNMKLIGSRERT